MSHHTASRLEAAFERLISPAVQSGLRRAHLRNGVEFYRHHRTGQLRWLGIADGPEVIASLRRAWRSERNRCAAGHWSGSHDRACSLWQAMVAERALRLASRRTMKDAA